MRRRRVRLLVAGLTVLTLAAWLGFASRKRDEFAFLAHFHPKRYQQPDWVVYAPAYRTAVYDLVFAAKDGPQVRAELTRRFGAGSTDFGEFGKQPEDRIWFDVAGVDRVYYYHDGLYNQEYPSGLPVIEVWAGHDETWLTRQFDAVERWLHLK